MQGGGDRRFSAEVAVAAVFLVLSLGFFWQVVAGRSFLPAEYLGYFEPWKSQAADVFDQHNLPAWNPLAADGILQYYPWRAFAHRQIAEGRIPLWNPYQFCGTPFVANGQSAVFYLPNVVFWLLRPAKAFGISAILHFFFAGWFAYLWARSLGIGRAAGVFAGLSFMFCGFMVVWAQLPALVCSLVWLPLALACLETGIARRSPWYAVGSGIALALSILAGHPQIAYYVVLTFFCYSLARVIQTRGEIGLARGLGAFVVLPLALCLSLASIQIFPTLELASLSHRAREAAASLAQTNLRYAIGPENMVTLLIPGFLGTPDQGTVLGAHRFVETCGYLAIPTILLAVFGGAVWARQKGPGRIIVAVAVVSLLVAFGTPLAYAFSYLVPGFARIPAISRLVAVYSLFASILAGWGLQRLLSAEGDEIRRALRAISLSAVLIILFAFQAAVVSAYRVGFSEALDKNQLVAYEGPLIAIFLGLVLITLGVGALALQKRISARFAVASVSLVALANLWWIGIGYNRTCSDLQVFPKVPAVEQARSTAAGGRVMPVARSWPLFTPPDAALPPNSATVLGLRDVNGYDSLFSLRYKEFTNKVEGGDSSPPANGNMILMRHARRAQRREMAVAAIVVGAEVIQDSLDPERAAFLPEGGGTARIVEDSPNKLTIEAVSESDGILVVRDALFPGWHATASGHDLPIGPWFEAFRAVALAPGKHRVEMRYEPASFAVGSYLSLLGIFAAFFALGWRITCRSDRALTR
jgi:hypothetical protein